jgi:hypothetical protein
MMASPFFGLLISTAAALGTLACAPAVGLIIFLALVVTP